MFPQVEKVYRKGESPGRQIYYINLSLNSTSSEREAKVKRRRSEREGGENSISMKAWY